MEAGRVKTRYTDAMVSIKARVQGGRIVVDEATDLPDGTEVELVAVMDHSEDALGATGRAAVERALTQAATDIADGRLVDGDEVLERLQARDR
ncbi:MAG: hypothetical protein DRJ42_12140 [Deltaproteobacteria bacterium]|nr:MAG: hypothetical protein DRJ42_12140 [Deltaproteobacteria bacterium]